MFIVCYILKCFMCITLFDLDNTSLRSLCLHILQRRKLRLREASGHTVRDGTDVSIQVFYFKP